MKNDRSKASHEALVRNGRQNKNAIHSSQDGDISECLPLGKFMSMMALG